MRVISINNSCQNKKKSWFSLRLASFIGYLFSEVAQQSTEDDTHENTMVLTLYFAITIQSVPQIVWLPRPRKSPYFWMLGIFCMFEALFSEPLVNCIGDYLCGTSDLIDYNAKGKNVTSD